MTPDLQANNRLIHVQPAVGGPKMVTGGEMKVYAVRIGKRLSGDDEMIYLWRKKKLAIEYTIFLHAGKVVTMELTEIKSPSGTKEE